MGFVSDIVGGIFGGGDSSQASNDASAAATAASVAFQREALDKIRADLEPYRTAGSNALSGLSSLITDPNAQKNFIIKNPFYNSLAGEAKQTVFNNAAAKGKVGSGGTAEALQNSLLLLGSDLLNQNITQRQNLANMGESAAAQTGTATQNTANQLSSLTTAQGAADAANAANQSNSFLKGVNNLVGLGSALWSLSDARYKRIIRHIGFAINGLPVYIFKYLNDDETRVGVMAQDVEKINPHAVMEHQGVKYVNLEAALCP